MSLIAQDQRLAGVDDALAPEVGIILQQNANRNTRLSGNGTQRIAGLDGVYRFGVAYHDGLAHRQAGGVGELVVRHEPGQGDAVFLGNGIEAVPCLYHMNIHSRAPQTKVMKLPLA